MSIALTMDDVIVLVPNEFPALVQRRLDLDHMEPLEPAVMAEMYSALADDFDRIGYPVVAEAAKRRAAHWGQV